VFTKQTAKRAVRTFIQSAVAYVAVNITLVDFSSSKSVVKSSLIGLAVSAIASAISAVMNLESKDLKEE
jgi:NADH:ubiquinone oxidoreductase subunit K